MQNLTRLTDYLRDASNEVAPTKTDNVFSLAQPASSSIAPASNSIGSTIKNRPISLDDYDSLV